MFTKPRRMVKRVFLHCSASDSETLKGTKLFEEFTRWHKARGFSEIGYHFVIDKEGALIPGRSLEKIPAAQAGNNTGTIAICLHGLSKDRFTQEQFATLTQLADEIEAAYGAGNLTWHGHREVAAKECPVFDYKSVLGLNAAGQRTGTAVAEPQPLQLGQRILSMTSRGMDVVWLQEQLGFFGDDVDGIFGRDTHEAVFAFQKDVGLVPDGVVGPKTWDKLLEVFHGLD